MTDFRAVDFTSPPGSRNFPIYWLLFFTILLLENILKMLKWNHFPKQHHHSGAGAMHARDKAVMVADIVLGLEAER